jgi:hypothetical protein
VFDYPTLESLVDHLGRDILSLGGDAAPALGTWPPTKPTEPLSRERIAEMADTEIEALILRTAGIK